MARLALLLCTTLLFGTAQLAQAQRSTLILGEWIYSEPLAKETMDAETREALDYLFSDMWFSFREDGTFRATGIGQWESGTWAMDPDGTRITLTPTEGPVEHLLVKDVTATTWLMELEPGKGFKLVHGTRKE